MHIVTLTSKMIRADGQKLAAGEWLCDDVNAFEIAQCADRGTVTVHPNPRLRLHLPNHPGARKLLCIHLAGYGDMIMFEPVLRAWKAQYPQHTIHVACRERARVVLEGTGLPDAWVDYPVPLSILGEYDGVGSFENLNEVDPRGRKMHATDLKAEVLGIDLPDDARTPRYIVSNAEREEAALKFPRRGLTRLGVQLRASADSRSYPAKVLSKIMGCFYQQGWEVFLFRNPDDPRDTITVPPQYQDRVIDLGAHKLSFRQSVAVLDSCHILLAPDSSLMHAAGALGLPCVALFGSTHYKQRTIYYPTVFAIQGHDKCPLEPCWYHGAGHWMFPRDQVCATSGRCETLASIDPDLIIQKIRQHANS